MKKTIENFLFKVLPKKQFNKIKSKYRKVKKKVYSPLGILDLERVFKEDMGIKEGDTVFVHASVAKLNLNFAPEKVLKLLLDIVGENGNLLFPSWHFSERAEDFFNSNPPIFNIKKTRSKMGFLSEYARLQSFSFRSLHPTNSTVAIGVDAEILTQDHHKDIYPLGKKSPFYKVLKKNSKLIGLGVDVNNLTYFHCIEDVLKNEFPMECRKSVPKNIEVINSQGERVIVKTLLSSKKIRNRKPVEFAEKFLSKRACNQFNLRGNQFFVCDTQQFFEEVKQQAKKNNTIYSVL
tara:strand:+ start:1703 stop:2578 length:876 start_codon:yes stop_codon:yes gene_type:complete